VIPSRPGHFTRVEPPGYAASFSQMRAPKERAHFEYGTIIRRANRVEDPDLAYVYDQVRLVVSGPLFSAARWDAIYRMHFGDTLERARQAAFYQDVAP
jgi:hypothetical protein